MLARTPIYAFNGGELSRRMEGRSDLDGIYDRGVALMLNFVATVEGPALKRSGTRYIREALASAAWLTRFIFNTTQAYVLEWGDQKVRFYTNGGRIETAPGVPFELEVPYSAEEAKRISIKQSFDRLYLAHPNYPPAMITRTAAATFTYQVIPLKNGPYKDWNTDRNQTITWAGSGAVDSIATITCSHPIFAAGHLGGSILFEVVDFGDIRAWESQVATVANASNPGTITTGTLCRSAGKVYKAIAAANQFTGTIEPTHNEGAEWDGSQTTIASSSGDKYGVKWEYQYDRFGAGTITQVVSATQVKVMVTRRFPTLAAATYHWALGAFSEAEGYPQVVDVWGQRLIFWKSVDIAGSVVGDYFDFSPINRSGSIAPDQGFRRRLDTADPPQWSHADKEYLLAGTASGELVVGPINPAAGLSSDNLRADSQSAYGSAEVWPTSIATAVLFVQRGGRKIREAAFAYSQERFVGSNINIYARHITRSGLAWLAFQAEPEEMLWCGRKDGTLIAHPHNQEQGIKGFARVELAAGTVLSGVTIPSVDGERDELWILAELDGQKAVLQLADWWDEDVGTGLADAYFVDWGVSYDGNELDELGEPLGPKQVFSTGLSHLEGLQVRILADGVEINTRTVVGGSVTLPKPAMKVHIGLGYQAKIKLLRAEARGTPPINGLRKRLVKLLARLIDTASLIVRNRHGETDRFFDRSNALAMDTPAPLFNGDTGRISVGTGSDFDNSDTIENDDAYPCMISQLLPEYDVEELER